MSFEELLKTFKVQPDLERKIWNKDNKLDPKIKKALLDIAQAFYDSIDLENKPPIKDIVFTGSLANYNWSKYSDIDLHLLFDFEQYGEHKEAFENLFLLAKSNWNNKHDVRVKGYEVEVYAEDEKNPHHSTGVYSVMNDKWVVEPKKQTPIFDPLDVKSKAKYFVDVYKQLVKDLPNETPEELLDKVENVREKIRKFRQGGLETGGEFSTENIAFKTLRRMGLLDKLAELKDKLVDRTLSVETRK